MSGGSGDGQDTIINADTVPNSTDILSLANWYGDEASMIDQFEDGDVAILYRSEIDQLVSAMAAFTPSDGTSSSGVEPGSLPTDVQLAIDTTWQAAA